MFGYVKPQLNLLSESERALYQSVYCGLCRALGKICGQGARFTLNYDFTFLAILRMAVCGENCHDTVIRCPAHPIKGRCAIYRSDAIDYSAALSILLTYESIQDKLNDEKGFRYCAAAISEIPLQHYVKKVQKHMDIPAATVKNYEPFKVC